MPNAPDLIDFLSPPERLDRLRSADEDQWFDRKSARVSARSLAETLVAFANAEGGLVVIGLSGGVPADAAADSKAANGWRQAGIDYADPPVRTEVRTLDWADATGRTGSFILIRVPPSEGIHATTKDEVFLRIGDEIARLLRDAGHLGTGEIMKATGRSRPWVIEQLRLLVDAGVIEWAGKSPSDPRAYWRLRVD